MTSRPLRKEDLPRVMELMKEQDNDFPGLKNLLGCSVIEEDGKIIAVGFLQKFVEGIWAFDSNLSNRKVIKIFKVLNNDAIECAKANDIDTIHGFIKNMSWFQIILRKFGYRTPIGETVYLHVSK